MGTHSRILSGGWGERKEHTWHWATLPPRANGGGMYELACVQYVVSPVRIGKRFLFLPLPILACLGVVVAGYTNEKEGGSCLKTSMVPMYTSGSRWSRTFSCGCRLWWGVAKNGTKRTHLFVMKRMKNGDVQVFRCWPVRSGAVRSDAG